METVEEWACLRCGRDDFWRKTRESLGREIRDTYDRKPRLLANPDDNLRSAFFALVRPALSCRFHFQEKETRGTNLAFNGEIVNKGRKN